MMEGTLRWLKAYLAAVIVGSVSFTIAFPLMLGTLGYVSIPELLNLLVFAIAVAFLVALGPTILLYHSAFLIGWTGKWVFILAGMTIPVIGAIFVTTIGQGSSGVIGGAFLGLLLSPCGALAGFVFHRVLGQANDK